jgi:YVTN family beta-propeller protein
VDCGAPGVGSLCYNARAGVVYGATQYGPFFAISAESNKVVSSTPFDFPIWVVFDSLDNKAYCFVRTPDYDTLMVMDGTTHSRIGQIPLEWADRGVWDPDNDRLYVGMGELDKIAVIDCRGDTVVAKIHVGQYPMGITLNRQHQKLYVLNMNSESVTIIDLVTNEVIRTIRLGNVPQAGCYSSVADKYYCGGDREVVVIDGVGDTVMSRVPVADLPSSMLESPAHGVVMVGVHDTMLTLDVGPDTVLYRMRVGVEPNGMVWSSATDQVYCAVSGGRVAVFPGGGERVALSVPVGSYSYPFAVALAPEHGRLYVGCLNTRYVYVIRDTASAIEEPGFGPTCSPQAARASPNPFSSRVSVECPASPGSGRMALVCAADGRVVRRLLSISAREGVWRWTWDGKNDSGEEVPEGVYLVSTGHDNLYKTAVVKLK